MHASICPSIRKIMEGKSCTSFLTTKNFPAQLQIIEIKETKQINNGKCVMLFWNTTIEFFCASDLKQFSIVTVNGAISLPYE